MTRATYGIYGSPAYFAILAAFTSLSLVLVVFVEPLRMLFTVISLICAILFVSSTIFFLSLGSLRTEVVSEIIAAGKIGATDRVLDVGTGRGFPATEIAKAVPGCRAVGIDLWDKPATGQWHKGFILGNSKENAERNALVEGVQDRVEFRQCDASEMPFGSESFDVIVSYAALHQMIYFGSNGDRVLSEINRVLKPSGRLVNVDLIIERRMIQKLREIGFTHVEVRKVGISGFLPSFIKILYGAKEQWHTPAQLRSRMMLSAPSFINIVNPNTI